MRMTEQRKAILNLFKLDHQPKSADMILAELSHPKLNLSTVYRTLDAFFNSGLIAKSTIQNVNYYYLNHMDHHHYMICIQCKTMYPIDCHLDDLAKDVAKKHHFHITHHDMTIYGLCENCQKS